MEEKKLIKKPIKKPVVIARKRKKKKGAYSGTYIPANPRKYRGSTPIIYRSKWELKFMKYLDMHQGVVLWSSESVVIPYYNPVKRRQARYFPDFTMSIRGKDGKAVNYLIEVKPFKETHPPIPKKGKRKKTILYEQTTWAVNEAKWKSAIEICKKRGWVFKIITEYEIFNRKNKPKV